MTHPRARTKRPPTTMPVPARGPVSLAASRPTARDEVLRLQRNAGNAAVSGFLARKAAVDALAGDPRFAPAEAPRAMPVVQRRFKAEVSEDTFLRDAGADKKKTKLVAALRQLLKAARDLKPEIDYEWFAKQARGAVAKGESAVRSFTRNLAKEVSRLLDPDISGHGGHMYEKHILVTKEQQEARLTSGEVTRSTRPVMEGHSGDAVAAFIRRLERSNAVETIRDDVSTMVFNLMLDLKDVNTELGSAWMAAGNNVNNKKKAVRDWLAANVITGAGDPRLYTLEYEFEVQNPDGATGVKLRFKPALRSTADFDKDLATMTATRQIVHTPVSEPLKMFWGRNNPVFDGIDANADADAKFAEANAWNPEGVLGITMF